MTFEIIALICSLQTPPQECARETARSFFKVGEENSELACIRRAQMSAAGLSLEIGSDEYRKFICVRR